MSRTSAKGRTRQCGPAEAMKRLADAEKYLEIAELVESEADDPPSTPSPLAWPSSPPSPPRMRRAARPSA